MSWSFDAKGKIGEFGTVKLDQIMSDFLPVTDPHGADTIVILVAAGRGTRAGAGIPKQYRTIGGIPLIRRTIKRFIEALPAARILPVIHPADRSLFEFASGPIEGDGILPPAFGGQTRQQSVHAGLEAIHQLPKQPKLVLIHDCARPFTSIAVIHAAVRHGAHYGAAIPGIPVTDTIKQTDCDGWVTGSPPRHQLRAVQTPQSFHFDVILAAHRKAAQASIIDLTDDAAVAEWAGHRVHIFAGDPQNVKITTAGDFDKADQAFHARLPDIRMAQGFDVHAFGTGDHVWLGGVRIPHPQGLVGHSDADVLMHAMTDALYGALAEGDIGSHFPPSDPQWRGAASEVFLRHAASRVRARGGIIGNLDGTVICERPKVDPHRNAIRVRLAEILAIDVDRISVKATTTERLGFTGRDEGIAALATATIRLPLSVNREETDE